MRAHKLYIPVVTAYKGFKREPKFTLIRAGGIKGIPTCMPHKDILLEHLRSQNKEGFDMKNYKPIQVEVKSDMFRAMVFEISRKAKPVIPLQSIDVTLGLQFLPLVQIIEQK